MSVITEVAAGAGALVGAGLVGGGWVVLRSSVREKTTELWRQEATALDARLKTVEALESECREKLAKFQIALGVLRSEQAGTVALTEIASQLAAQHIQLLDALKVPGAVRARRR